MIWWIVAGAVVAALIVFIVVTYNQLVAKRNQIQDAWAGIDVQLQRRADLVPNLVETVKGYQIHEQELLTEIATARSRVVEASGPRASGQADEQLERSLGTLFAVAEAYPDLKASENFLALQRELATLEEDISFARRYYTAVVKKLNTMIQTIPTVLIARPMGFRQAEYFKAEEEDRAVPSAEMSR